MTAPQPGDRIRLVAMPDDQQFPAAKKPREKGR
jgi:hypothetical protein